VTIKGGLADDFLFDRGQLGDGQPQAGGQLFWITADRQMQRDSLSLRQGDCELGQTEKTGIGAEDLGGFDAEVEMSGHGDQPTGQVPAPSQAARDAGVIETPVLLLNWNGMGGQFGISQASGGLIGIDGANGQPAQRCQQAGGPSIVWIAPPGALR
jgi:hypothetical protein